MRSLSSFFIKLFFFLFILIVIGSLIRTIWTSYQALENVKQEEKNVQILENETQKIEEKLQNATSSFELERRAREDLQLQKSGESVIKVE